ncbi:C40 family peptidase [Lysinimonas soli]|uniref:C40 family peptidase n=1 Tax=Lysinimonas soli TaxID=1074233 RepID=A0ABW0NPL0_9MICO
MSAVSLLGSLQQLQANLASAFPSRVSSSAASASSTLDPFSQVLAALSPSTATTSSASGSAVSGSQVVTDARKYLGVPYVLDGESTSGIDCSGLVQLSYKDLGITLPRTVHEQKLMGTAVPSLAQAQPGDLIVFKGGGHVAIYEGNGRVLHAPYPGRVVSDQKLWVGDSGIETIRRIVPDAGGATGAAPATTAASTTAPTSAAVQAAALATVRAVIQADFGLLSGSTATTGRTTAASSPLTSAIQALAGSVGSGVPSATAASNATAAQQVLATMRAALAQVSS